MASKSVGIFYTLEHGGKCGFSKAKDSPEGIEALLEGRSQRMSEDIRPLNPPRYMQDVNVCVRVYVGECVYCRICGRMFT